MYCRYITGAKKIKFKKKKTYLGALKTVGIGYQCFQKRWYRPFKFYSFKIYVSTFKSVDIGILNFIHSRLISVLLKALE